MHHHRSGGFQFTPLREGRRRPLQGAGRGAYFNSRPSARGDGYRFERQTTMEISIHAPPRGATILIINFVGGELFQFTPLREGRLFFHKGFHFLAVISIHAPPRGATARESFSPPTQPISIHAPPRGATSLDCQAARLLDISIHAPPRGATTASEGRTT